MIIQPPNTMFMKKMEKFRARPKYPKKVSYEHFDDFSQGSCNPDYGCSTPTSFQEFTVASQVSGNLDEFSFPLPTSPETRLLPTNPSPTPERVSYEEEDALTDDSEDDENTDYASCREAFSETASPFHIVAAERRHHDHHTVVKGRNTRPTPPSTKQNMGNIVALATAKVFLCRARIDDVANANIVISKPSPSLHISSPTNICHVIKGKVNPKSNSVSDLESTIKGYDMPKWMHGAQWTRNHLNICAPALPEMMMDSLYSKGGLKVEGIFRINADSKEDDRVRKELNKGKLPADVDVHCLAGLIKAWFREFPKGIFDCLTPEEVLRCNTEEDSLELVRPLPELERRLLDWVLNLMADVVDQQEYNRMNARNIATVFAPNLSRDQIQDPLAAVKHVVQVINLLKNLVNIRVRERKRSKPNNLSSFRRRTVG